MLQVRDPTGRMPRGVEGGCYRAQGKTRPIRSMRRTTTKANCVRRMSRT